MREYWLTIDEALKNGLSPQSYIPPNVQLLENYLGFRCGKIGAEAYNAGIDPLSAPIDMHYNYPFPQFIKGETFNVLIVRDLALGSDVLYEINDAMTSATLIGTSTMSGTFEMADFGKYAIITNGVNLFYYDYTTSSWVTSGALGTIPTMKAICNFYTQTVGGGVTSFWYDCDEKYYVWSKIGKVDFTPDMTNEASYVRCPFGGTVYHTRKLGNIVIGYSTRGIVALQPISSPAVTFSVDELDDVGIINQGAMAGNFKGHLYVGNDYSLRYVTQEGVKDLDYKSHIEQLGSDIIVNFDSYNNDFFITNGSKTFLLSPNGLSEIPQHPTAVWRGQSNELYVTPDTIPTYEPLITTGPFNMGYGGRKEVSTVETDLMNAEGLQTKVDVTYNQDDWESTQWKPINNEGIATIPATGTTLKFHIKAESITNSSVMTYITSRYKMADLRGIRGVYAPSPRGQS